MALKRISSAIDGGNYVITAVQPGGNVLQAGDFVYLCGGGR